MTFGRSPDATCGTFLAPVSSKFNGESNAHTHLVCRRRESSKNRDFSRNGKIFLKSRTCPGLGLEGLIIIFKKITTFSFLDPPSYKFMSVCTYVYVHTYVRPSVSNTFLSELVHLFFLIFCMKLEIHKCTKV